MTMDTAGKAVLFSGVTVLISLTAVMLVPSPAFRSMSLGIMLAVIFVLAATLTLLPAVLAKLGPKVDNLPLPWAHSRRAPLAALRGLGRAPLAPPLALRDPRAGGAARARLPGDPAEDLDALDQGRPDSRLLARRLRPGPGRDGPGGHGPAAAPHARGRRRDRRPRSPGRPRHRPGHADPARRRRPSRSSRRSRARTRPTPRSARPSSGCAASCPRARVLGGAVAENHDLQNLLSAKTPLVIGVVLVLGFLLLLFALQAPLLAAAGVLTNLLATGAAFGVSKWIFQDGDLHSLLGLPATGLPGRVGAGVLLRDDLRDLDGLHDVPALLRQGALGPQP